MESSLGSSSAGLSLNRDVGSSSSRSSLNLQGPKPDPATEEDKNSLESKLSSCQNELSQLLDDLYVAPDQDFLSFQWMTNLLQGFIISLEQFKVILFNFISNSSEPPLNSLLDNFSARCVKASEFSSMTDQGFKEMEKWLNKMNHIKKLIDPDWRGPVEQKNFLGARECLKDLAHSLTDDEDFGSTPLSPSSASQYWYLRDSKQKSPRIRVSVLRLYDPEWSAVENLKSIAVGLKPPRVEDIAATNKLEILLYTMSRLVFFVTWILVAALPCLSRRGLDMCSEVTREETWDNKMILLQKRVLKHCTYMGPLQEIRQMRSLMVEVRSIVDTAQFNPKTLRAEVKKLRDFCNDFQKDLNLLMQNVRDIYDTISKCSKEILDFFGDSNI